MVVVLIVAAGAAWESPVLELLSARSGVVVLKRCVDVDELIAAGSAGQADVAVVALDAPGLDQAAVDLLHRHRLRVVAVAGGGAGEAAQTRAARIGIAAVAGDDELARVADLVEAEQPLTVDPDPVDVSEPSPPAPAEAGGIFVVWGPAGAPGRTTLAAALAAGLARRELRTTLVDADPYGGAVAQHLGVLDEVSGLLSAARLVGGGALGARFGSVQRALDGPLTVVTGLPRADRWMEVRAGAVERLLEVARTHGHVVADTGFSLEDDPARDFASRPGRNQLTLGALSVADEVVVVGNADPVGLSRLARGLVELRDHLSGAPVRVVVNRMRPSLGWTERDIVGMVEGFTRLSGIHFLPHDRAVADRALVAGRSVLDVGDSELARAVLRVVDALAPSSVPASAKGHRRRRVRAR
jgi:MinD-like ATPase involved in chromosome partitioning or flagellar assembly